MVEEGSLHPASGSLPCTAVPLKPGGTLNSPPSPLLTTNQPPSGNIAGIVIGQNFSFRWKHCYLNKSIVIGRRTEVQQGDVIAETGYR